MRTALAALVALPLAAAAQVQDSVPARLHTVMASLDQRSIVRVRLRTGLWAAGPFQRSDASTLEVGPYIGFAETPQLVPLAGTDSLWIRRTSAGSRTWQGAILGSVLTAATATAAAAASCEGKYCTSDVGKAAAGGAIGGALLGGVIGMSTPRWHLRFGRTRDDYPTWAVTSDDTSAISWQLWRAVAALPYQAPIRLRMAAGPDVEGRFERATALGVQLRPVDWTRDAPAPEAPVAAIRGLFERGTMRKELAVLGGAIGLGAAMVLAVDDTCAVFQRGDETTTRCAWRFLGAGVLGGIGGAWLGREIGRLIPRWHRRF